MKHLKKDFDAGFSAFRVTFLILLGTVLPLSLSAQGEIGLRASVAASAGYAPIVTQGSRENTGLVVGVYGELEYGKVMGRLQYTKPLLNTFNEDKNLDGGNAYHGSLGYRMDFTDQLFMGLLVSGGATVVQYNNGFNGSSGDTFTNVSPQLGVIVAPTYQITDHFSVQGGLRYYKGFKAGDRGQASDLADISIALRFSL